MKTVSKAITHTFACECVISGCCRKTIYALCLFFQFVLFSPIFLIVLKQMVAHFYRPKKPNNRINVFPDSVLIIIFVRLKLFKKKIERRKQSFFEFVFWTHIYTSIQTENMIYGHWHESIEHELKIIILPILI